MRSSFSEKLHRPGRYRLVAAGDAPEAALGEEGIGGLPVRHVGPWEVEDAELEVDGTTLRDTRCRLER